MSLTDCPTCGRSFETVQGAATHHAQAHPGAWRDRFWHYVDRGGPGECWEWQGYTKSDGYGRMDVDGENHRAHRLSYRLANGDPDEHVLHHCDNPPCVNPAHLYDGDRQDNADDMWERGRGVALTGGTNPRSKLTRDEVVEIREKYAEGDVSQTDLADEYEVGGSTVGGIVRGETWPDAPGPIQEPMENAGEDHPASKLTQDEVVEIREKYAEGDVSQTDLADEYGVGKTTVADIVRGETWPDAPGPIKGRDYDR